VCFSINHQQVFGLATLREQCARLFEGGVLDDGRFRTALEQLTHWSKCLYFPDLTQSLVTDPNWLTKHVLGFMLRVSKRVDVRQDIWPDGSRDFGLCSRDQLGRVWPVGESEALAKIELSELLELLHAYGLLTWVGEGEPWPGAVVALLTFMLPLQNQLSATRAIPFTTFSNSTRPSVCRVFVLEAAEGADEEASCCSVPPGISSRVAVALRRMLLADGNQTNVHGGVKDVAICRRSFILVHTCWNVSLERTNGSLSLSN
jgi:hypothetical protein